MIRVFIVILFLFIPMQASAILLDMDLYSAKLPVEDQTNVTRAKKLREELKKKLVKISTSSQILNNKSLNKELENIDLFVSQYYYEKQSLDQTNEIDIFLNAKFNQTAISSLLDKLGIPYLPNNRPSVLIWLDVEAGMDRQKIFSKIESVGLKRGIPLILPLYDLEDRNNLSDKYIASKRYQADLIISANIDSSLETKISSWHILDHKEPSVVFETENLDDHLDKFFNYLSRYLLNNYSNSIISKVEDLEITIENVDTVEKLSKVEKYLQNISSIDSLFVKQVSSETVTFMLKNNSSIDTILNLIELDNVLAVVNPVDHNPYLSTHKIVFKIE